MKNLRYIIILLALSLGLNFTVSAQDSRGRVASTIVADGLAQLPAQNLDALEQVMGEIAGTGVEGINMLVQYLNDTEEGKGATFEYAIDGLTSYVSAKGRENLRANIREGLKKGVATAKTNARKAFYVQQLAKIASEADVPFFEGLLTDNYLKEYALAALTPFGKGKPEVNVEVLDNKSGDIAALHMKVSSLAPSKQAALLLKSLKNPDRNIRTNALSLADELKLEGFDTKVIKTYPKLKTDAQADVLRWLGNNHNNSTAGTQLVVAAISNTDDQLSTAAIEAAGRIGGTESLNALVASLDGKHSNAAKGALQSFNGNIKPGILKALQDKGADVNESVVALAGERRIHEAYKPLTALIGNNKLHKAATTSLAQIVTAETYDDLLQRFRPYPDIYYLLLAQRGNKASIDEVVAAAKSGNSKKEARAALLKIDNADVVPQLFDIAKDDASVRDDMLNRVLTLTQKNNVASLSKYQTYKQVLDMKPSAATANRYLAALGTLNNEPALNLAAAYMDVKDNDLAAANAVTNLIAKNEPFQRGAHIREMLLKAQQIFKSHTEDANAGYAVDQVNTLLPKIIDDPNAVTTKVTTLSEEEKKAGFELLFDGTNLDKWTGDKNTYVPIDGAIYVSAQYGSEGNLYTTKKYSDFVFRFEFCFVRPGINNGVGIRTTEGVDAAYEGMEIQILDHDDPIYKGLRDYQVHGSVYGIIPAKRYKHKPLGTWNYEEIRAEGDHITVTLNGEVIVDGNIREACQGHNMAPEGSKDNPYTVDHKSHPGLFNKDGLICFCGHGEGLKLRNIRVLDLSQKKTAKGKSKKK
ncbi:MAG: DUF1080 domain-containing protein [Bacteroidaceae bacterium]|nr:DUF1080 domain-containing protein [Bacteroidaceae bacterium]